MTRLLLIGLLTVLPFSVNSFDEQPVKPWVEPKVVPTQFATCAVGANFIPNIKLSDCIKLVDSAFNACNIPVTPTSGTYTGCTFSTRPLSNGFSIGQSYTRCSPYPFQDSCTFTDFAGQGQWINVSNGISKECPPDFAPEYTVGPVPESDENPSHEVCKPKFTPCPLGYFKNQVTNSSGQNQCVPVSCPDKGTRVNNVFNKDGILTVGSSGTYCDGKCSYTIQPSDVPYNGSSFSFGTSNGQVCGQGDYANIKFTPTDKENSCTTHTLTNGQFYQVCSEGDGSEPQEDNAEGELSNKSQEASVDNTTKPSKYQGADCSITEDKLFCVGTEILESLDHQTAETKKQQDEKHNKMANLQTEIAEYVETKQRERFTLQSNQSQLQTDLIVGGLTQITTAINNTNGNGNGNSEGNSDLIEQFDGDSLLNQFQSSLDSSSGQLDSANSDLDSKLNEGLSKFGESDTLWNPFKDIPTYLPNEYVCQPFILSTDEHPLILDLCEYEELIKAVIGFIFIMLTAMRLFYQAQIIVRNSAIGSA